MGPKIPRLNLWCFASLSVSCPGGAVIKKKKKKLRGTIIEHISNLMVAFCKTKLIIIMTILHMCT